MKVEANLKEEISQLGQKIRSKDDIIEMKEEEIEVIKDLKLNAGPFPSQSYHCSQAQGGRGSGGPRRL